MDRNAKLFLEKAKFVLSFYGVWMLPYRNLLYKFYTSCVTALHGSFFLFNLIHMAVVWGDVGEMSEGCYLLFTHIATCYKTCNFVIRKDKFSKLLKDMDTKVFKSKSAEHDLILAKNAKRVNKIYLFLIISAIANCVLWGITPQLDNTQKILPFNVWMPGDTQTSPSYEVGYVLQMLMICNASQIFLGIDVIFMALIMFTCAQMEIIMADTQKIQEVPLSGLSNKERNELIKQNNQLLINCIIHQQTATRYGLKVKRFLNKVVDMFHVPIFIQMSGSILIVCVVMFRVSVEPLNNMHFYSNIIYLFLMLAQVFLYCWSGTELTIRSEQLRDRMYLCPWYSIDNKFRRTLYILMECLKSPVVLRAGHYIPLSRPTFVSILRCSYSYYAVLNQAQRIEE